MEKCGDCRVNSEAWRPWGYPGFWPKFDAPNFSSELGMSELMAVKKKKIPFLLKMELRWVPRLVAGGPN